MPTLSTSRRSKEQVRNNSGIIGFIIIGVGIVGILIAFLRLLILTLVSLKVRAQLRTENLSKKNPLGRVLLVGESNPDIDTETLELKLGEAILQETPSLESMLTLIKMIATIAPLGGLLGTVTGMIEVFQQITVYGAGDPTIMAGGISQAPDDHGARHRRRHPDDLHAYGGEEPRGQYHPYPGAAGHGQ